jgi:hypothetical protein
MGFRKGFFLLQLSTMTVLTSIFHGVHVVTFVNHDFFKVLFSASYTIYHKVIQTLTNHKKMKLDGYHTDSKHDRKQFHSIEMITPCCKNKITVFEYQYLSTIDHHSPF